MSSVVGCITKETGKNFCFASPENKIIVLCFYPRVSERHKNLIRNAKSELNYQRIKKFNQVFELRSKQKETFLGCAALSLSAGLLKNSAAARQR